MTRRTHTDPAPLRATARIDARAAKCAAQICVGATMMSLLASAGGAPRLGSVDGALGVTEDATTPPAASGQLEFEPEEEQLLVAEARSDGSLWSFP